MRHTLTLNIGLAREGKPTLGAGTVLRELAGIGMVIYAHAGHHSATEPTLVARVSYHGSAQALGNLLYQVADSLGQDCIAVVNDTTSAQTLIGPRADKWLPFNPAYFLTLNGAYLA